jgi:hypothetical protein
MLQTLRRLVSFADWGRNHPSQPPDGGDLDATFDALFRGLGDLEQKLLDIRRSDGSLKPEIVTIDAIQPLFVEKVATDVLRIIEDRLAQVENARSDALSAKILTEELLVVIEAAADRAAQAATRVDDAKGDAIARAEALLAEANALLAGAKAVRDALPSPQDYEGDAQAWAQASMLWAEHMPDVLPRNSLVWQDISGDHWSSRWWANRADNAFGRLTDLYLGAWSDPPLTNLEGGPIEVGSIYYDLDDQQPYVWDGSSWQPFWSPQRSLTATLWYQATAGQTVFQTTTPDIYGSTYRMAPADGVDVHVDGVRKVIDRGAAPGEYVVDNAASKITLEAAPAAGKIVAIDIIASVSTLVATAPAAWALQPLVFDGVTRSFSLLAKVTSTIVSVGRSEELVVSLDGVIQEPGVAYTATGASINFSFFPEASADNFITWFQPATPETGAADWDDIAGKPSTFPPSAHTHPESEIVNLVSDLAGKLPLTGGELSGPLGIRSGYSVLTLQATANHAAVVLDKSIFNNNNFSYVLGSRNGVSRWRLALGDSTGEFGSNGGSDFALHAYDDAGADLWDVLRATRTTGLLTVRADPTAPLGIATKQYVDSHGGLADAPSDGVTYGRNNGAWSNVIDAGTF